MGQMKPAAMRTQKTAANAMTVAVGAPAESVCTSATVAASRPATAHRAATARVDGPPRMAAAGRIPSAAHARATARQADAPPHIAIHPSTPRSFVTEGNTTPRCPQ